MAGFFDLASKFFQTFLHRNISFTLVALAIIFGRLLLKRFPKKYSYLLWICLAVRALFDIGVHIKLPNLLNKLLSVRAGETIDAVKTVETVEQKYIFNTQAGPMEVPANGAIAASKIALGIFFAVWILGALYMVVRGILGYVSIKKKTAVSFKEGNLYRCDYITSPMAFGFIHPRVYIPSNADISSMGFVIEHEKTHIRRGDVYFKLIAFLIFAAYWMNPIAWICFKLFNLDMELSCDESVILKAGIDKKNEYSKWLLFYSTKERSISLAPTAFGETDTKRRVKNIMGLKKKGIIATFVGLMLTALVIVVCFILLPERASADGEASGNNTGVTEGQLVGNEGNEAESESVKASDGTESKIEITWVRPFSDSMEYHITGGYVDEPNEVGRIHKAIDIAAPMSTDVYAIADGVVEDADYDFEAGNYVVIKVNEDITYKYKHLEESSVQKGATVKAGDIVAKVGSSGRSTGPHLHLEILVGGENINPMDVIDILDDTRKVDENTEGIPDSEAAG